MKAFTLKAYLLFMKQLGVTSSILVCYVECKQGYNPYSKL